MNRHRLWYLVSNAIPNSFREVKWAFQRVFRGHDERVMWGLEDFLAGVIPDIKKFCESELSDEEHMKLNPERKEIYTATLFLIKEHTWADGRDHMQHPNSTSRLWEYVGKHVGYFWD